MTYEIWRETAIDSSHDIQEAMKEAHRAEVWVDGRESYAEIRLVTNAEDQVYLNSKEPDADGDIILSVPELVTVWLKLRKIIGVEGYTLGTHVMGEKRERIALAVERAVTYLEHAHVEEEVTTDLRAGFLELLGLLDTTAAFKILEDTTPELESTDA